MKTITWVIVNIIVLIGIFTYYENKRAADWEPVSKVVKNYNSAIKTYHEDRNYFTTKWYDVIEPALQEIKQNTKSCK